MLLCCFLLGGCARGWCVWCRMAAAHAVWSVVHRVLYTHGTRGVGTQQVCARCTACCVVCTRYSTTVRCCAAVLPAMRSLCSGVSIDVCLCVAHCVAVSIDRVPYCLYLSLLAASVRLA